MNNIINLKKERLNRVKPASLVSFELLEHMVLFLEYNPCPIKCRRTLQHGIHLFEQVYIKCNTMELKQVALGYIELYNKEMKWKDY